MTRETRRHAEQSVDYLATRLHVLVMARRLEIGDDIENNAHHEAIESEIARTNRLKVADC
tara:strand:- start:1705 stop:1884 length:180 start_codon:yes stop_codon:yes gene_type:complete